jgi:hypothetical protein
MPTRASTTNCIKRRLTVFLVINCGTSGSSQRPVPYRPFDINIFVRQLIFTAASPGWRAIR